MKSISDIKSNICKKILLPIIIVMLLVLSSVSLTQYQAVYAETFIDGEIEESIESKLDGEIEEDSEHYQSGWRQETLQTKLSVPMLSTVDMSTPLEKVVDLSAAFPEPGDQRHQSSCTAWAVGYAAKSCLVNAGQKWGVKNHQFSPAYIYNQINGGVDEGSNTYDAMKLIIEQGVCLMSDMPYDDKDFTTQPTPMQRELASQYRSLTMKRIEDGNVNDIKITLHSELPVVIGVPVYPDLDDLDESNPIYDTISGTTDDSHALCLVGYDDNKSAFKFINSWGKSWGLNGYGYISYSLVEEFQTTGWVLYDAKFGQFADSQFSGTELTQYIPIENAESAISVFNGITKIGDDAFANQTGITSITLPSTLKSIGDEAFSGCTHLGAISSLYYVETIGDNAFKNCVSLREISITSRTKYIGNGAFSGCNDLNIAVSSANANYCAVDNILYNKAKAKVVSACNVSPTVHIPQTVTEIAPYAFEGNTKINKLYIEHAPRIGDFAFADCSNFSEAYFYSYSVPSMGIGAFLDNDFTLYTPHSIQGEYCTAFSGYTNRVASVPIKVTFVSNGRETGTLDTYYGAEIADLIEPFQQGYDFAGWYENPDHTGTVYQNGGFWDSVDDLTVYAKWIPRKFYITFSGYGAADLADKPVTYDSEIGELPVLSKYGNTFLGWKDEHGVYYTDNTVWQRTSNLTLFSDFKKNEYAITYIGNGGTPSKEMQSVEFESVVTELAVAERAGHTFTGWNTRADGTGDTIAAPYVYNVAEDMTLYAQYAANVYVATFDKQGGIEGADGVEAEFGLPMPEGSDITAPILRGCTFRGYYSGKEGTGTKYYNADMTSAHDWDIASTATLYAYYTANSYVVVFDKQGGVGGTDGVTARYCEPMPTGSDITAPTKIGHTFRGYFTERNGMGIRFYNADMTSANNWIVSSGMTLYAHFAANSYYVIFDKQDGSGGSDGIKATYAASLPSATAPSRPGYTFNGYYSGVRGTGRQYYDGNMKSVCNWNIASDTTLYAYWQGNGYSVMFDKQGGSGGTAGVSVIYGSPMPETGIVAPTKTGYTFKGYFTQKDGFGAKYYDGPNIKSVHDWDLMYSTTLYAHWEKNYYTVILDKVYTSNNETVSVGYGDLVTAGNIYLQNRIGYDFKGFYSAPNGKGTKYFDYDIEYRLSDYYYKLKGVGQMWNTAADGRLYAYWTVISGNYKYSALLEDGGQKTYSVFFTHGVDVTITAPSIDGYVFDKMWVNDEYYTTKTYTLQNVQLKRNLSYNIAGGDASKEFYMWYPGYGYPQVNYGGLFMEYKKDSCIAEGSLITLADGSRKAVEDLSGDETLLVWDLRAGTFSSAPILFIDKEPAALYEIINLRFSDGTHVKVIDEHAFWDFDLNEYVFLRSDADKYIGHCFNKQILDENGNMSWTKVRLIDVTISEEFTTVYSPVTYGHLCLYVNGMLSMPGATEGLINIFEVDGDTMKIDEEKFLADVEAYGLYTYEEFAELYSVPENAFDAICGEYLKVSLGKGLITHERLRLLIERYLVFFQ